MMIIEELRKSINTKDDKKQKIQIRYNEIKLKINEIENQIKNTSDEYFTLKTQLEENMGEDGFNSLCPDIDTNPEKYMNVKGKQIKTLAELCLNIKLQHQELQKLRIELETIQKLMNQPDISASYIMKQLKIISIENHTLIQRNIHLTTKFDNFQVEMEDLNKKLEDKQKIIDEFIKIKQTKEAEDNMKMNELKHKNDNYKKGMKIIIFNID